MRPPYALKALRPKVHEVKPVVQRSERDALAAEALQVPGGYEGVVVYPQAVTEPNTNRCVVRDAVQSLVAVLRDGEEDSRRRRLCGS